MNRERFLTIVAIVLLVSNLMLVSFIYFKKSHPPRHMEPKHIIIEKLRLDEGQIRDYEQLIQWHRSEVRKNEQGIMELKNRLYQTLNTADTSTKDSIIVQIGSLQRQIEQVHYKHFADIRALCRPDQLNAYRSLTEEIAALFGPHKPPKDGPPPPPPQP